jgi:hypothetical protein
MNGGMITPLMDNSDLELRACCMLKVQMKQGAPWLRRLLLNNKGTLGGW